VSPASLWTIAGRGAHHAAASDGYSFGSGRAAAVGRIRQQQRGFGDDDGPIRRPRISRRILRDGADEPAGLSFTVDGAGYTSAQVFSWVPGSAIQCSQFAAERRNRGAVCVEQLEWTAGRCHTSSRDHSVIYRPTRHQYYLTMIRGPVEREPSQFWTNSGADVPISATTSNGYVFSNWTGSGSGSYSAAIRRRRSP